MHLMAAKWVQQSVVPSDAQLAMQMAAVLVENWDNLMGNGSARWFHHQQWAML